MTVRLPRPILRFWQGLRRSNRRTAVNHSFRRRGDSHRDAGQFAEAAEAYRVYLEQTKDDFDIWVQNGNCLKDAGRLTQARSAYETALALRPDDADLHLQMGHLAKLMGNHTEALDAYGKSFELSQSRDAAIEIENINAYFLTEKSGQSAIDTISHPAGLLPVLVHKDACLPMEASILDGLMPGLYNKVPIKVMTPLPAEIRILHHNYELSRQAREVSLLISKQSTIPSGEG